MPRSERYGFHAPSEEQIALAKRLGVTIPSGISRMGLKCLIDKRFNDNARNVVKKLNLKSGKRFRNKSEGTVYLIRDVRLERNHLVVYNETKKCGHTISLGDFDKYYEVIR